MIWGLPESHWLAEGEVNGIWVTEVDGTRIVMATEVFPDTSPEVVAELDAIVASIRLGENAAVAVATPAPPSTPVRSPEPTIQPLPSGLSLQVTAYLRKVTVYDFDATGQAIPVDVMDAVLEGQTGWTASSRGIVSDPGPPPPASLSWWSVGTIYHDPCRWDTSELGTVDPALLRTQDGLRDALSRPEATPGAPRVAKEPIAIAWLGLVYQIQIAIPDDVDTTACDAGQYRLWAEHDGTPRLAYPGEQIQLDIVDFDPGLLVVDTSWRPVASVVERGQAEAARNSLWIGRPPEPTASP
jgi:hypothetical protein